MFKPALYSNFSYSTQLPGKRCQITGAGTQRYDSCLYQDENGQNTRFPLMYVSFTHTTTAALPFLVTNNQDRHYGPDFPVRN